MPTIDIGREHERHRRHVQIIVTQKGTRPVYYNEQGLALLPDAYIYTHICTCTPSAAKNVTRSTYQHNRR